VLRRAIFDKKTRQTVNYIIGGNFAGHHNGQRLPTVLIDNGQNLDCPSVLGPIRQKIIGPDMVTMRGPKPNTGAVIEPQPTPFRMFLGDLKPLLTPNALYPLVVYPPTIPS
jgi:hypothetical protein